MNKKTQILINTPQGETKEFWVDAAVLGFVDDADKEKCNGGTVAVGNLSPMNTSLLKGMTLPRMEQQLDEHMRKFSPIELLASLGKTLGMMGGKPKKEETVDTSMLEKLLEDLFK